MDSLDDSIDAVRHIVAAELCPALDGGRVDTLLQLLTHIDATLGLEVRHAGIAVAIVSAGEFIYPFRLCPCRNRLLLTAFAGSFCLTVVFTMVLTGLAVLVGAPAFELAPIMGDDGVVFHPKAFRENHVGIADIVELHIVHLRDFRHLGIVLCQVFHHLGIVRVDGLVVFHIGTILLGVGTLSEAVDGIPCGVLPALEHRGHPGMVLQSGLMSQACSSLDAVELETATFHADTDHAVLFPHFIIGPQTVLGHLLGVPFVPSVNGNVCRRFAAAGRKAKTRCQGKGCK